LNITAKELNNRKYTLITEITRIENEAVIKKIEKLIDKETKSNKSPLSFTQEELKLEIAEAEKETILHSQNEVKAMSWKK
jgi:hypothetical protein